MELRQFQGSGAKGFSQLDVLQVLVRGTTKSVSHLRGLSHQLDWTGLEASLG